VRGLVPVLVVELAVVRNESAGTESTSRSPDSVKLVSGGPTEGARSLALIILEGSLEDASIVISVDGLSTSLICDPVTSVGVAADVFVAASSVSHVLLEGSSVLVTVGPFEDSAVVLTHVVLELASVLGARSPEELARTVLLSIDPGSDVLVARAPGVAAIAVLLVVAPFAFVLVSIGPVLASESVIHVLLPMSFVSGSVFPRTDSLSVFLVLLPFSNVDALVGKDLLSQSFLQIVLEFTLVQSSVFLHRSGARLDRSGLESDGFALEDPGPIAAIQGPEGRILQEASGLAKVEPSGDDFIPPSTIDLIGLRKSMITIDATPDFLADVCRKNGQQSLIQ